MKIIGQSEAKALGLKRFFTGQACKRGHVSERGLAGHCLECLRQTQRAWRLSNIEDRRKMDRDYRQANLDVVRAQERLYYFVNSAKILKRQRAYREANVDDMRKKDKEYREANPDKVREAQVRYRAANPEKVRAAQRAWRAANPEKARESDRSSRLANPEKVRATRRAWEVANPAKVRAQASKRRAAKLNATPAWADLEAILAFYEEAARITAETGASHQVDHIVPLQGATVCGLHVENNLQVITSGQNAAKKNRYWPDMWVTE